MQSRLLLVAALPALALAACSLVTNFDDLASGGAAGADAGGGADATTDVGVDAAVAPDGSGEAGADSAAPPFCSGTHAFCADFDEGSLLDGWTTKQVDALGMIEQSGVRYVSPGASFHSFLPRRAAGDIENAVLVKYLPGVWKRTVVDFEFFLERPDFQASDINAAFLQITFAGNGSGSGQTLYFTIGEGYSHISMPGALIEAGEARYDGFVHVHLDIQPGTALSATLDGKTYQGTPSAISGGPGTRTELYFGITGYNAPVPAFSAYYDNIVVDQL